jgi:hypothetical protein
MGRIDDFNLSTKKYLAARAGYRCSFLGCGRPTFGPSEEDDGSTVNAGMACHISAASPGKSARRYLASMLSDERKSIDNGIWMCYTHGKIIDADESRFSIDLLKRWKEIAEKIAQLMVEKNIEYAEAIKFLEFNNLISEKINIGTGIGNENQIIGDAILDCGVRIVWGRDISNAIRDFLIEHARNAFIHGKATEIQLEIKSNRIILIDNGEEFNPKSLYTSDNTSGGTISIKELINRFDSNLVISSERKDSKNITVISKLNNQDEILEITPCSYKLTYSDFRKGSTDLEIKETCNEIFIVLPTYISPSDVYLMNRKLLNLESETRPVTFITKELTDWVVQMIKDNHPNCQVIEIK